jgi:hypothetical protein
MGKTHEEQIQLKSELELALTEVEVGARYRHYKAAHKIYTVLNLAFQEEDNELCVIYQADYEERLTYIRPLVSWLAKVEWEGESVPRFTKLSAAP